MIRLTTLWMRRFLARLATALALLALTTTGAFAGSFLDNATADLKPEERVKVAEPRPVQLLLEFQTKGVSNQRATKAVKKWVDETVQASGAFTTVGDGPAEGGALLSIVINNIPQEGAAGKGFVTGLTFGLKGSLVADYYECTVSYTPRPDGTKVTKVVRHTIYTTIGAVGEPPNATKVKNIMVAVETMVRQVVAHGVNDVAGDPGFTGAAPPAEAAAPATAPPPAPAPAPAPADATPPAAAPPTPKPGQ